MQLLMVLFETNLLSNISTKTLIKHHILCLISTLKNKIGYRFNAGGCVGVYPLCPPVLIQQGYMPHGSARLCLP